MINTDFHHKHISYNRNSCCRNFIKKAFTNLFFIFRCRHNANSRCVHCSPLEPYDESYLREQNIKHLSFHSYLRKMTSGVDRGKFLALEDISCRIKEGCKGHPPWPKGICSKCQPNAITLNSQVCFTFLSSKFRKSCDILNKR